MKMYNVKNIGGEILNLDGPLNQEDANKLADEIEAEHNIDLKVVEVKSIDMVDSSGNHVVERQSSRKDRSVWELVDHPGVGYVCHAPSETLPGSIVGWYGEGRTLDEVLSSQTCWDKPENESWQLK